MTPNEYAAKHKLNPKNVRHKLRVLYGKAGDGSHKRGATWQLTPKMIAALGRGTKPAKPGVDSRKHFVAYHNRDELGPYHRNAGESKEKESRFFTAKRFRDETLVGQQLWIFEGSGSPKRYSLISEGVVIRLSREKRPQWYRKPKRQTGTRVHFRVGEVHAPLDVTEFPWFRRLLSQQQYFRSENQNS
jgi:hypothetical protein